MRMLKPTQTRQPAGPAAIEWGKPITKGLRWWTGAPQQSLRAAVPTTAGQAFAPTASVVTGPSIAVGGLSDITMLSFGVLNGTANAGNYQAGIRIGATLARLEAFTGNTQISAVCSYSDFTATTIAATAHGVSVTGGIMALGLRHIRGASNGMGLFVNGRLLASNTAQNKTLVNTTTNVEAHWAQAGTNQDYLTSFNALWDRALSDQEIASLSVNPWQLFRAPSRRGWVFGAGASGSFSQTITGSLLLASGLIKSTSTQYTGSVDISAGPVANAQTQQAVAGTTTVSGLFSRAATYVRNYTSQITLSGNFPKSLFRTLQGVITAVGTAAKGMYKTFTAFITSIGTFMGSIYVPPAAAAIGKGLRFMRKFIGRR